ncbi:Large ribosomal subunit protein bL33m [Trichinella pseudospiralis]
MPPKSKYVVVALESVITGYRQFWIRSRSDEKVETLLFDPCLGRKVLFKEVSRVANKSSLSKYARERFNIN